MLIATLDPTSWYELKHKRESLIQDKSMLGHEFYHITWAIALVAIWSPLFIISLVTALPFRTHTTQYIVSCMAVFIRVFYMFFELVRLRKTTEDRAYEMWVQSFDETKREQVEDLSTNSSLHLNLWKLSIAVVLAVTLVATGAKIPAKAWLWWIGVTIFAEVVFRVVIQILWWKTRMGKVVELWLRKKGKW